MIKHILKLIWNKKGSNALMTLEIFLSFLVLFFVMSYVFYNTAIINKTLGFETVNKWIIHLDAIDKKDSLDQIVTMESLKQNLMAVDEVVNVSFMDNIIPFTGSQWRNGSRKNGFPMNGLVVPADLNLKEVLDLNIVQGRWFNEDDLNEKSIPSMVVNKTFIDRYYPDKNMIDSTIFFDDETRIVGVIDEFRYMGEFAESEPTTFIHVPYTENMMNAIITVKPNTPSSFEQKLSDIVKSTIKNNGSTINTLEKRRISNSRESWIMLIALLAICGFLCLNVALGLFGVLWYNISKRKSEIGLRQALGATAGNISRQFIIEIMILTAMALLIGIFFAIQIPLLKMTEYPSELFYKAIMYASLIILMLVFLCAVFPSLQASRITPANSLHED